MGYAAAASAPPAVPVLRIRLPPAWTPEEDARLERLAREHGFRHWRRVAARMVTGRSSSECRRRWRNHLARDDDDLARLYVRHGGRWREMSRAVHGRTSRVMRRRWREVRDSDAFLSKLWKPALSAPPTHQDAAGTEPTSPPPPPQQQLLQQAVLTCERGALSAADRATRSFFPQPSDSIPLALALAS